MCLFTILIMCVALGGFPENEGTARGALHRGWMTIGRVSARGWCGCRLSDSRA